MKQEKLKQLFMLCLFGMISIGASAEEIPNDEIWYTSSDGNVIALYDGRAFGLDIVSNTYANGKGIIKFSGNVIGIGSYAFCNIPVLTSVTIPNSVTLIGYEAFDGCSGLTSVTIGNSVETIGERAFDGCSGLTSVTIPNSVTSIGYAAFAGCSGLTSVAIPNSVTSIGYAAFAGCSGLTSVTIGNSVTEISDWVFEGCDNVKELIYAEGTKIVLRTNLTSITSVTIPNSVTSIGDDAFRGCSGLTSLTIPNSVTSIGESAFDGCSGLTSVTIGNSVTSIGRGAFYGCSGLTSVEIPNSVTSIGKNAFYGCSGLTSVTIPNSVTSIGNDAFSSCSGVTSIVVESGNKVYDSRNNCNAIIETASNTLISGCKNTTIPNSVTSIGDYAFFRCSGLTSVTIPNSVTEIGSHAFYNCSGLTSVKVHWKRPLSIYPGVWDGVDKQKCTLYVPEGTWAMYCSAPGWMDFVNIEEFSEEPGEEIYLTVMGVHGAILQQAVEIGKTYKYLLDNKKNGKIVSVTFNGEDVTADVTDGKYTTPKITGNSEIYVEYDNQPLGDTNLDGNVNVNDITATAKIILSQSKEEMESN